VRKTGYWHNLPTYVISLLKAWYGDSATPSNGFGYDYLPKISGDYSFQAMTMMVKDGII
jgi:formate dehydrogenase major subunit